MQNLGAKFLGHNEIPKNKEILKYLYVSNFNLKRLHTFILMDDAAFVLKNDKSPWFR